METEDLSYAKRFRGVDFLGISLHFISMRRFVLVVLPIILLIMLSVKLSPAAGRTVHKKISLLLKMSPEMKRFAEKRVIILNGEKLKLEKLILFIYNKDFLNLKYSDSNTYTAEETFRNRRGNCLSYTAMFISLARYVGLRAYFQEVNDLSSWTIYKGVTIFSRHVNALVIADGTKFEVDFGSYTNRRFLKRKKISDRRAEAHFYNNKGVEEFLEKRYFQAEEMFGLSLGADISFSPAWINLGLLKQEVKEFKVAEICYKRAYRKDKYNITSKYNLAILYEITGRSDLASELKNISKNISK